MGLEHGRTLVGEWQAVVAGGKLDGGQELFQQQVVVVLEVLAEEPVQLDVAV